MARDSKLGIVVALLSVAGAAHAHDCAKGQPATSAAHWFDRLDADADATVTRPEARAALARAFEDFDRDGDGAVTRAEADAGLQRWRAQRLAQRFAKLDRNGDGILVKHELGARRLAHLDADRDAAVTLAELRRGARGTARVGARSSLGSFAAWDGNGDGRVTRDEARRELERRFGERDRNADGRLERREVRARPRRPPAPSGRDG